MAVLPTLLTSGVVSLAAGAAFIYVGWRFRRSHAGTRHRLAVEAFSLYWMGVGLYTFLWGGVTDVLASLGYAPFGPFLVARHVTMPLVCIALGALMFYFAFLFTGRRGWIYAAAAVYGLVLVASVAYVQARDPVGVSVQDWRTDLAYAEPFASPVFSLILLLLVVPPMIGAVAYATLARKATDRAARRRILLVSSAIFLWSGAALLARLSESDLWQLVTRPILGALVAALVLYAYAEREGPP